MISEYEKRFENGYNIYTDINYVAWLQQFYPDCLPSLGDIFATVTPLGRYDETSNTIPSSAPVTSSSSVLPASTLSSLPEQSFIVLHSLQLQFHLLLDPQVNIHVL